MIDLMSSIPKTAAALTVFCCAEKKGTTLSQAKPISATETSPLLVLVACS